MKIYRLVVNEKKSNEANKITAVNSRRNYFNCFGNVILGELEKRLLRFLVEIFLGVKNIIRRRYALVFYSVLG